MRMVGYGVPFPKGKFFKFFKLKLVSVGLFSVKTAYNRNFFKVSQPVLVQLN